jgi:hypothetical protein
MRTVREALFKDWEGCSNGNCIVQKREGMHTNGDCNCLLNMSRSKLHILKSRLSLIIDKRIEEG